MTLRYSIAIIGAQETDHVGVIPEMSALQLHAQAAKNALRDAGIDKSEVDGLFTAGQSPAQIGEFRTQSSRGLGAQGAGDYSIHNALVVGTDVYLSWYSDGVRVVDASDPEDLTEVAYFVPPAGQNPVKPPQRGVLSQMPQVWGVVVDEDTGLIYASDMNSGLWILRRT